MNRSLAWLIICTACAAACPAVGFAQSTANSVALRPSNSAESPSAGKFTFLLFMRDQNANSERIANELSTALATHGERAQWRSVLVSDPANAALVQQYQLNRAPMPLVLCVAPNGAITGVMPGRVSAKQVEASLVTPTMTRSMKSLQAGKIVVVHVKGDPAQPLPQGAANFVSAPSFKDRAVVEGFLLNDPAEARFLKDMEIDPASASDAEVVVLAPPGTLVGKFPATATAADIAAKLHAAGKCCDDPNCKHNRAQ